MADAGHYELLDPVIDAHHRSRISTMLPPQGEAPIELGALRLRTPIRAWRRHPDWVLRLRAAGLLPLARMVEATWEDDQDRDPGRTSRRFPYDRALLTALVDRWRPETHTFHLLCGEMAPTLQDVTFLTGLPCTGFPMAAYDIPATWRTDLPARFHDVLPPGSGYTEFSSPHEPTLRWICQFYPERMAENADDVIVRGQFEAYLLWIFGWVML